MSNVLLIWRSNVVFQGSLLEAVESTVGSTSMYRLAYLVKTLVGVTTL